MTLSKLTLPGLREVYDREIMEAFPPNERKPFWAMKRLFQQGRYLPYGVFDPSGALLGYALLWSGPPQRYVLLDYFGVTKSRRNGGLGGGILRLLQAEFADWEGIVIESEAPDGGPEDDLRRRRLDFYRRSGGELLPYDAWLFGVRYKSLLLGTSGRHDPARALEAHRALYHSQFKHSPLRRFVQIPAGADNE